MLRPNTGLALAARVLVFCAILVSGRLLFGGMPARLSETDRTFERWSGPTNRVAAARLREPRDMVSISGQTWPLRIDWMSRGLFDSPARKRAIRHIPEGLIAWDSADPFEPTADDPIVRGQTPALALLPMAGSILRAPSSLMSLVTPMFIGNGRIRGDYVTDFDETDKVGMQILTQGGLGAGIDAEVNYWQRPVAGLGREPLWTGDLNVLYSMSPISRFKLRAGAGGSWMLDNGEAQFGYNFTYGLDVYLLWRAMFTSEIDYGKIGGDELFRYRLGLGLTFNAIDIFTGYESQEIDNEELDGWMSGIALWY